MKLITKIVFTLVLFASIQYVNAQEFTLDFSDPQVNCNSTTVCYDVTMAANISNFGLGSYNLRLFYDASRIAYVTNSPNVSNLPATYSIGGIQNNSGDLTGFGSLSFEASLALLEIGVDYTPSTPQTVSNTAGNILQNLCFAILDPTILSDNASCFDLIWVNETSRENYTNAVTTINNASSGTTADLTGSVYNDLSSTSNCLADACIADPCVPIVDADGDGVCDVGPNPDPDSADPCNPNPNSANCTNTMLTYELDFSSATVDCGAETVCYDVLLSAPQNFDLGSYNLRIFYDADLLDLIDASPNLSPGSALSTSYNISSINDMQGGNMVGGGSLPFEDNIDIVDIAVDYLGSNPITASTLRNIITHDLCFNILDQALVTDPAVCIHAVWVTNTTEENYTNGETTVNVAGGIGVTADNDNSIYNDLEPSGEQCLINDCADPVVYELDFTNGNLDCGLQTMCYDITIEAPEDFELGSYNLRLFYDADLLDLIDISPNLDPGSALSTSYNISSINDMQGGDMTGGGSLPFDDNIDIIDIAVDYLGSNPLIATTGPQIITHDLCFNIEDQALIADPTVCIHAVWVTNATEENYTVGETTVNVAGNIGITTDIDNSIYNDLDPSGAQCLENACLTAIPTMGEWGLICLALILLIFGVVAIKETSINLSKI